MDVLLPEDPQEENNAITATAMEGETTSDGESLNRDGTSREEGQQKERKKGGNGGTCTKEGEGGAEMKEPEGGGSGEAAASGHGKSQAAGKGGKHASGSGGGGGRKPRTKGLIKKLQGQVIRKIILHVTENLELLLLCDCLRAIMIEYSFSVYL